MIEMDFDILKGFELSAGKFEDRGFSHLQTRNFANREQILDS